MAEATAAQPDVTLLIDTEGVIREARFAKTLAREAPGMWIGRRWSETVADTGGDKVRALVDEARSAQVSIFRQINQRLPSGLEVLMEYTAVRLGGKQGVLAIGRSLQAVADLQSRLIAAQQAMERDYWKLREIETRYRMLFDVSGEAVLLVREPGLEIREANPAAARALGLDADAATLPGRSLLDAIARDERDRVRTALARVRDKGKAPGTAVRLGPDGVRYLLRASLLNGEAEQLLLVHLAPAGGATALADREALELDVLIERSPDGVVVIDAQGRVVRANRAFLDMVQVATERSAVGQNLSRWLGRPGADFTVLVGNVERYGTVRLFATSLESDLGAETEVEISAAGDGEGKPRHIALVVRDVSRRIAAETNDNLSKVLGALAERVGKTPLRDLVRDTVEAVERHYVDAALSLTAGNRTAAAQLLGLSRQSLYAKLDRYAMEGNGSRAGSNDH